MLRLIADLAKNGLTTAEIQRAKTAWRSQWLRAQQGNGSMADAYAWNEINGLGHAYYQSLPARIAAITDKDIKRAAKAYLDVKQATVVRVMPETAP